MTASTSSAAGAHRRPAATLGAWWARSRPRLDDAGLVALTLLAAGADVLDAANNERLSSAAWAGAALTTAVGAGLWWRRRAPLVLAVLACAAVAAGASRVALVVTLLTLAARRGGRALAWTAVASAVAVLAAERRLDTTAPLSDSLVYAVRSTAVVVGLPVAAGAYARARRELLESLRERARRAEAEQRLRAEQARLAERTRIAREMHDVLAHQISLVALHAGGLEVSAAAAGGDVGRSAALVRTTAHQALEDLRAVLGVLRGTPAGSVLDPSTADAAFERLPQPSLGDVQDLVHASGRAGVRVRWCDDLPAGAVVSPLVGRTAYRLVQEALTNVRKHAPGAQATVRLSGAPGADLVVEVADTGAGAQRPVPGCVSVPGSGLGLLGLHERVDLAGGSLVAGPQRDGRFVVRARLPWPAASAAPAEEGGGGG